MLSLRLPELSSAWILDVCLRGFPELCQENQARASHSLLRNINVGRYEGERADSFYFNCSLAGRPEYLFSKSLLFMCMVRLALSQPYPLKQVLHGGRENRTNFHGKAGNNQSSLALYGPSLLLRHPRQKRTSIRLCNTTIKCAALSSKPYLARSAVENKRAQDHSAALR